MCGIVGMAGNTYGKHSKMFRDMLTFDYVRGVDSTGVAAIGLGKGPPVVEKAVGHPANLWSDKKSELFDNRGIFKVVKKVMIGHNRAATVGVVNTDNAHPFVYEHITGVHNGSLTDWYDLEGWRENDVDSMSIFQTIAEKGIDHCWKNFHGAAALVYWDEKEETLNLIRNTQRPLWVAHSKNKDVLFWASEYWMIEVAAERSDIDLEMIKDDDGVECLNTYQLKENVLHVYSPTTSTCKLKEVRELEKKPWLAPLSQQTGTTTQTKNYSQLTDAGTKYSSRVHKSRNGINTTWAAGLDKAEKSVVGLKFRLTGLMTKVVQGQPMYNMIGRTEDQQMVLIYPSTTSERGKWEERVKSLSNGQLWFKMVHRPRITDNGWAISTRGVEFVQPSEREVRGNVTVLHPRVKKFEKEENWSVGKVVDRMCAGFTNREPEDFSVVYQACHGKVTKRRWKELMAATKFKGECAGCSNPLDIEDHQDILWIDDQWVLCGLCASVEETVNLLRSGNM